MYQKILELKILLVHGTRMSKIEMLLIMCKKQELNFSIFILYSLPPQRFHSAIESSFIQEIEIAKSGILY